MFFVFVIFRVFVVVIDFHQFINKYNVKFNDHNVDEKKTKNVLTYEKNLFKFNAIDVKFDDYEKFSLFFFDFNRIVKITTSIKHFCHSISILSILFQSDVFCSDLLDDKNKIININNLYDDRLDRNFKFKVRLNIFLFLYEFQNIDHDVYFLEISNVSKHLIELVNLFRSFFTHDDDRNCKGLGG